jgi:hypothetical protein
MLTEASSNVLMFGNSPMSPQVNGNITVLIEYSTLINCSSNAQQLGSLAFPSPSIVIDIAPTDTLNLVLNRVITEIKHTRYNGQELAIERMEKIELSVQWNHGQYFGQCVINQDVTLSRCLVLMEKRGWQDHFVLRLNDSIRRLEALNIPTEIQDSNGKDI